MRSVSLIACVSLLTGGFLLSTGPTLAADCTKGMLWPYVRAAGDCLTDAEIAAGQKGTYSGPTDTNVDVSAIKPPAAPAQAGSPAAAGGVVRSDGALIETSIFGAEPPARAIVQCHKGILWPFNREPGDCLTEGEKQAGQTGVFGGAAAATPASATTTVPAASAPSGEGAAPMPQTTSCSKSWLWPFVRESGDCPSAGDKKSSQAGGTAPVAQVSATRAVPPAATSATQAPEQASQQTTPKTSVPQVASCSKGLFWPFVKESSDCASAGEKQSGQTGGTAAMTQVSATTAVPAAAESAAQGPQQAPVPQAVSCSKGLFWPFVKESGDCASDAEKNNSGQK